MLLFIGFAIVGLILTIFAFGHDRKNYLVDDPARLGAVIAGIGILLILSIITPARYVSSLGDNAELQAFYDTAENYAYAIDKTSDILTIDGELLEHALVPIYGNIEKTQVGVELAKRIVEYRDEVMKYNKELARVRVLDESPITGIFVATPNQSLKLISIK